MSVLDTILGSARYYEERCLRLERALKPFANCVYNDNGDMTVRTIVETEPYIQAYFAMKPSE